MNKNQQVLIGIAGPLGSGKSSVAKLLAKELLNPTIIPFADPIKTMLKSIGIPFENLYGTQEQKMEPLEILGGKHARYAGQTLGTEWGRDLIWRDLWVQAWLRKAEAAPFTEIISDDVRFQNEVDLICDNGGIVFELVGRGQKSDTHESEKILLTNTVRVSNRESIESTVTKIKYHVFAHEDIQWNPPG